jgi:hypothetical protein
MNWKWIRYIAKNTSEVLKLRQNVSKMLNKNVNDNKALWNIVMEHFNKYKN